MQCCRFFCGHKLIVDFTQGDGYRPWRIDLWNLLFRESACRMLDYTQTTDMYCGDSKKKEVMLQRWNVKTCCVPICVLHFRVCHCCEFSKSSSPHTYIKSTSVSNTHDRYHFGEPDVKLDQQQQQQQYPWLFLCVL